MLGYQLAAIAVLIIYLAIAAAAIYLLVLVIKALRKYINSKEVREEKQIVRKSLAEALRENRVRCKMTQEFVSETLGVSRQAVSKWENGTSDPSTSNLIALANLYGVSAEELLKSVEDNSRAKQSKNKEVKREEGES
ncbi:helix-turn-helix transcriptional regulator [Blautia liquoris]|uniref:Helix-turn-helix transcriptional regulator n=1 Tax=Blautia liquoris TaxID=2779518 RepID=A0A7M2RLH4_9FIRM|nr:helix-turn-helix transcriptional regulator [Blautia liquoris]QOV20202.1 helix-turn-helix transcriptional regulator [Blautia liquoris]